MGTFTASFELGMGAGAIVMGWIATQTSYSTMFLIGAAAPVLALLLGLSQARAASAQPETASPLEDGQPDAEPPRSHTITARSSGRRAGR